MVFALDACVGFNFFHGTFAWKPHDKVGYSGYKKFVKVVVLGNGTPHVVICEVNIV